MKDISAAEPRLGNDESVAVVRVFDGIDKPSNPNCARDCKGCGSAVKFGVNLAFNN